MNWIVDHGVEILFVFLAIMTGAALYFFRVSVDLERVLNAANKQIDRKGDEWHALNEERLITLEERDEWKRQAQAHKDARCRLNELVSARRERIEHLERHCQVARVKLRKFCSRPSTMVDVLDELEKEFRPNSQR